MKTVPFYLMICLRTSRGPALAAAVVMFVTLSLALLPSEAQATRHRTKPVLESENVDGVSAKLVVDTSGEQLRNTSGDSAREESFELNKMDKAAIERSGTTKSSIQAAVSNRSINEANNLVINPAMEAAAKATAGLDVDAALAQAKKDAMGRLPENEIPVLTKIKDEKKEAGGSLTRIFITLGVLLLTFGAASYGLKRWSARSAGSRNQNTRIRVLTQHHLGPKKTLAIVQVAGESILIGITDHNIAMLKTLSLIDDEVPEEVPNSFAGAMTDIEFDDDLDESGSNFALRGLAEIRDVVSQRLGHKSSHRADRDR